MKTRATSIFGIIPSIALATTLSVSIAHAVPKYCAETISANTIYSLTVDTAGGAISSSVLWSGGANLGGVATYGKYVFATDNTGAEAYLRVFDLTSRSLIGSKLIGSKENGGVQSAGQISVDGSGNVFVVDSSKGNTSARFAKITNWQNPGSANVDYGSVSGYSQVDVAGLATGGASILLQGNDDWEQIGFTTWDGSISNPGKTLIDGSNNPIAIAANRTTSNSYVLSTSSSLVDGEIVISTSLRTCQPGTADLAVTSISGIGQDVAMISDGTLDYAAVIRTNGSILQATRVGIVNGLANGATSTLNIATGDSSPTHFAQASADGKMLWVTAQGSGKVYGVSSLSWQLGQSTSIIDQIGSIATHEYYAQVPEPSSLITLLAMGAGALGILRRRK
ncbi:MAG: PEP-CTERM sorting domain-containing protein [Armatimonadetes bacterium]|nr:PEP-CTERM sorting domain-containing protein [Armatimonadota bacterium]